MWPRTTGCLPITSGVNNFFSTPYPDLSIQDPDPDQHHIDAKRDRNPAFHFDAAPDPTFHSDADPDPTFHSDAIRILPFNLMRIRIRNLHSFFPD